MKTSKAACVEACGTTAKPSVNSPERGEVSFREIDERACSYGCLFFNETPVPPATSFFAAGAAWPLYSDQEPAPAAEDGASGDRRSASGEPARPSPTAGSAQLKENAYRARADFQNCFVAQPGYAFGVCLQNWANCRSRRELSTFTCPKLSFFSLFPCPFFLNLLFETDSYSNEYLAAEIGCTSVARAYLGLFSFFFSSRRTGRPCLLACLLRHSLERAL